MANRRKTFISKKGDWKPVALDLSHVNQYGTAINQLDGLLGFEELTDYVAADYQGKSSNKKIKLKEQVSLDLSDEENAELDTSSKQERTKTKEKKKKKTGKPTSAVKKQVVEAKSKSLLLGSPLIRNAVNAEPPTKKVKFNKNVLSLAPHPTEGTTLHDMSAWVGLMTPEPVIKALTELGFTTPTSIQLLSIPPAVRDRVDILGAAETGSGKTLAFGIPIIHHILEDKKTEKETGEELRGTSRPLRALVVTPTRELAIQVKNHLQAAAKYTDIKIGVVVGGLAPQKQEKMLNKFPDIVVATPGRLYELIQQKVGHLEKIPYIKYLVVDEADRMVEGGHFEEFTKILEILNRNESSQESRQTFVFSATLTLPHAAPKRLKKQTKFNKQTKKQKLEDLMSSIGMREKPKVVDVTTKQGISDTLTESRISCASDQKDYYLQYFLQEFPGRTLVFCNSIDCIRRLQSVLAILERKPNTLHANMHQKQRLKSLERFLASETGLLLATDVAARGLDIPNIQHVVHYQVPRTTEIYVHRSGRTARAQKEGLSIVLVDPHEIKQYRNLCRTLNKDKDLASFPVDTTILGRVEKKVDLARRIDETEHWVRKLETRSNWFEQAAEELEIDVDMEEHTFELGDKAEQARRKRDLLNSRKELHAMLGTSAPSPGVSLKYPTRFAGMSEEHTKTTSAVAAVKKGKLKEDKLLQEILHKMKNKKRKTSKKQKSSNEKKVENKTE